MNELYQLISELKIKVDEINEIMLEIDRKFANVENIEKSYNQSANNQETDSTTQISNNQITEERVNIEEVVKLARKIANARGLDILKDILKKHNVSKFSELKISQYESVLHDLKEVERRE